MINLIIKSKNMSTLITINIGDTLDKDDFTEIETENNALYYHLDEGLEKSNAVIAVER